MIAERERERARFFDTAHFQFRNFALALSFVTNDRGARFQDWTSVL